LYLSSISVGTDRLGGVMEELHEMRSRQNRETM
jgi:hypothetical protein